jgi:hypothetical protein
VIALLCFALAFARNRVVKTKLPPLDVAVFGAFSAFMSLFILMLVNRMGFDYGYLDEILISIVYVGIGPPKFIYDANRKK